jgi:hypothetical protein
MKIIYWMAALLLVCASFLLIDAFQMIWFRPQLYSAAGDPGSVDATLSWVIIMLFAMSASALAGFYLGRKKKIDQTKATHEICAEILEQENPVASCKIPRQLVYTGVVIFFLTIGASNSFAPTPPWVGGGGGKKPPVSAPEPLTLSLIGMGISGCAGYYLGKRKR